MSVTPSSHVVGIFTDRSAAEQAVETLYNAGFGREQVHFSSPSGFFDDLKSIFTGTSPNVSNLASSLATMGLSDEEVQYYTDAYNNGNAIVAVNAAGREQEISNILDQYGAYGTAVKPHYHQGTTNPLEQPATYAPSDVYASSEDQITDQQPVYVAPEIDAVDPVAPAQPELPATDEAAQEPEVSTATSDYETTDQPVATYDTANDSQVSTATSDYETADQPAATYDTANDSQVNTATSDYETTDQPVVNDTMQEPQSSTTASDYDTADQTVQPAQDGTEVGQPVTPIDTTEMYEYAVVDQPEQQTGVETPAEEQPAPSQGEDVETPTYQAEDQPAPASDIPVDSVTEYQATQVEEPVPVQASETPVAQSDAVTAGSSSKLEELLQQVQTMRQQLEETKARLQAAKEHESQLQTIRQQMQELQKELESTQAELSETESRIQQY